MELLWQTLGWVTTATKAAAGEGKAAAAMAGEESAQQEARVWEAVQ